MRKDPLVGEVRKAGQKIEREAKGSVRGFFSLLRTAESTRYRPGGKAWAVAEERPPYGKT